jgi:hypothetical protein
VRAGVDFDVALEIQLVQRISGSDPDSSAAKVLSTKAREAGGAPQDASALRTDAPVLTAATKLSIVRVFAPAARMASR